MERLYEEYSPKGIEFLHCISGDVARTTVDFRKHYRSAYPHLLDTVRGFEKEHNPNGWPFYMVVDRKGEIVFAKSTLVSREESLEEILAAVATGKAARIKKFAGVRYADRTARSSRIAKATIETNPCLAADGGGTIHLSFVSTDRKGSAVRLVTVPSDAAPRGGTIPLPGKSRLVSDGCDDAYDAVLAGDGKGGVFCFFTGLAGSGFYDVFAKPVAGDGAAAAAGKAVNLTESTDDAMHPDAAVDGAGRLWVAYYRWCRMGATSRDKEIFVRCLDAGTWAPEVRLSPEDVPNYEDHTDPSIAIDPDGGVTVAWSWDMHRLDHELYGRIQREYGAHGPTIFGRSVTAGDGAGPMLFIGHDEIDGPPELYRASDRRLWCAWPTLVNARDGNSKALFSSVTVGGRTERGTQFPIEEKVLNVGRPRFFEKGFDLHVLWASQARTGEWALKRSSFVDGSWMPPVIVEKKGNPRQPDVLRDEDGRVWVAFTQDDGPDRRVVLRRIEIP